MFVIDFIFKVTFARAETKKQKKAEQNLHNGNIYIESANGGRSRQSLSLLW